MTAPTGHRRQEARRCWRDCGGSGGGERRSSCWLSAGTWVLDAPVAEAAKCQTPTFPADGTAPGAELVGTVLGWLKSGRSRSALAGLLIGAVFDRGGFGHFGSNYSASSAGRKWLMGGMGAAILSGLAWTIDALHSDGSVTWRAPRPSEWIATIIAAATVLVAGCSTTPTEVDAPVATRHQ